MPNNFGLTMDGIKNQKRHPGKWMSFLFASNCTGCYRQTLKWSDIDWSEPMSFHMGYYRGQIAQTLFIWSEPMSFHIVTTKKGSIIKWIIGLNLCHFT